MPQQARSCVIIVENLPVPFDRRVWQEAQALTRAGWLVSVICPSSASFPASFEIIDGVAIYRHSLPPEGRGALAYLREYSAALFHEFRLLIKVYRERGFSVIQACNPPDLIFLVAAPFKILGKRFIFDQHDVGPELFFVKYENKGFLYRALVFFERCSYAMADFVITANATFRDLAVSRGRVDPSRVQVVYGVPDRRRIHRVQEEPGASWRPSDSLLATSESSTNRTASIILCERRLNLFARAFATFGQWWSEMARRSKQVRELANSLNLNDFIVFTGYLSGQALLAHLSTFDIGVIPDPYNEANDVMSMNKVFEYCALAIPTASYPLKETKRLLGDAGVYAPTLDPAGLADACLSLMQDDSLRGRCAKEAARLAAEMFVWDHEADKYVHAYERTLAMMNGSPRS